MFQERYNRLNPSQKEACDHIFGPLLVVAGPGSGKTELLSLRISNILSKTDTTPENILCLTFTDAATKNLQQRLFTLIGPDALKVGIFTFHSFVNFIRGKYHEKFDDFKKLNEIKAQSILLDLMNEYTLSNKLCVKNQGDLIFFSTVYNYIQDFKKSGLTPQDLLKRLKGEFDAFLNLEDIINKIFLERLSKKRLDNIYNEVLNYDFLNDDYSNLFKTNLLKALKSDIQNDETKSLQKFKAKFLGKDENKNLVIKSKLSVDKIKDLAFLFQEFQLRIQQQGLATFDDLILDFLVKLKNDNLLRSEIAEHYNFIMVDEFQDTNLAQMEILNLISSPQSLDGNPNVMVVGDDDQAIYKFQGASVSNILMFNNIFNDVKTVVLNINYRSTTDVVNLSQRLLLNLDNRISNIYDDISKNLEAFFVNKEGEIKYYTTTTFDSECEYISQKIKNLIEQGVDPSEIAVLTRKNKDLKKLALYLDKASIAFNLNVDKNIFETEFMIKLISFINLVNMYLNKHRNFDNSFLSFLLQNADPKFRLKFWQISKIMKKKKIPLDEAFLDVDDLEVKSYLFSFILLSQEFDGKPFMRVFYSLLKNQKNDFFNEIFTSFFEDYSSNLVLESLQILKVLNSEVVDYFNQENFEISQLNVFLEVISSLNYSLKLPVLFKKDLKAVNLMTSHGSKGLEFENVIIMNCNETTWNRPLPSKLRLPETWNFVREKEEDEDNIRLFFVALTRAKNSIYFTRHLFTDKNRENLELNFLTSLNLDDEHIDIEVTMQENAEAFERDIFQDFIISEKESDYFAELINNWKISATSVADFLNIIDSNYHDYINRHVIKIPSETNIHMLYGTLMHGLIEDLYKANVDFSNYDESLVIDYFDKRISTMPVLDFEVEDMKAKALKVLPNIFEYFNNKSFNDLNVEKFLNVKLPFDDTYINLNGAIDLFSINKKLKTIEIYDFKTGKSLSDFNFMKGDQMKRLKAFRYKLQLHFYILIVNLRLSGAFADFNRSASLVFIENENSENFELRLDFDLEFYEKLKIVIKNIHQ